MSMRSLRFPFSDRKLTPLNLVAVGTVSAAAIFSLAALAMGDNPPPTAFDAPIADATKVLAERTAAADTATAKADQTDRVSQRDTFMDDLSDTFDSVRSSLSGLKTKVEDPLSPAGNVEAANDGREAIESVMSVQGRLDEEVAAMEASPADHEAARVATESKKSAAEWLALMVGGKAIAEKKQAEAAAAADRVAKEKAEAEKVAAETAAREQAAREQASREQAARDQAALEKAARDAINHRSERDHLIDRPTRGERIDGVDFDGRSHEHIS